MIVRRYSLTWTLVVFLAFAVPTFAESFSGKVVGVTDGDTIEVMHDGKAKKVRLHGVDCPESHQDFGTKAKEFTSAQVFGKLVTVDIKDTDRYGRIVGEVINQDGSILNRELVGNGYAWWYRQYAPRDTKLQQLEEEARSAGRGLWADPKPIAPWEFRRGITKNPSTPSTDNATIPSSTETVAGEVFITATGTKYHQSGCRYLSKSMVPSTLTAAVTSGYEACAVCNPPAAAKALPQAQEAPEYQHVAPEPVRAESYENVPRSSTVYQPAPAAEPASSSSTVYVTKTGGKYHSGGCQYLSKSKIPLSLDDARKSYGPCSRCSPPR